MLKFFQLFYCKKSMVSDHKLNIRWIHHYALVGFLKKINFFFFNSHLLKWKLDIYKCPFSENPFEN